MSKVKKTYVKRLAPSKPSLVCCRACLSTDGKLYNMHEYKLVDPFIRVSGITMRHDNLPHHLCSYCAALLRRCTDFQAKCGRAQLCLLSGLMQKDLSLEFVRSIDRVTNKLLNDLSTSGLTTIIIEKKESKDITPEKNKVNNIDTNNDNESNNVDTNNDNDITSINTSIDNNSTNNIDTNNDKNTTNKKDTSDDNDTTSNIHTNNDKNTNNNKDTKNDKKAPYAYIKYIYGSNVEVKDCKTEIDLDDDNSNEDVDVDNHIVDIGGFIVRDIEEIVKKKKIEPVIKGNRRRRKTNSRKKKEKVEKEKAEKNEPKKAIFREERISRIDFAKYERTYNMKIVTLSKEEQLHEIETRKQSSRYLEAAFHCEECGKGFQVEAAFKNHRKKHDPSAGDYPCEICTVRFKRHYILLRHKDTHRTQVVCQECGFISRTRFQATFHYRRHAGKKYCCQYCFKTCSTKSHYMTHVRLYHPTEHVSCELCGETFLGLRGVWQHKSMTHSVYLSQEYKCPVCSKRFISPEALQTHAESADGHQGSACDMCGRGLMSEELLRQHVGEQHPKCDLCHQTFLTAAAHRTHHKRKHLGERYDPMKAGAVRVQNGKRRQKFRPNKYMCEYCGKMQPCQAVLLEHKRKHENVRPFACPECPKTFCTSTQYKGHMRTHTGEKPFQCGHCSLAFGAKKNMERHILNKHMGMAQKVPCELCGRFFTTRGSMKLHVRTVHGGEPWPRRDRRPKAKRALEKTAEGVATDQ